ncbi:hypothetical protein BRYFOR_05060 [Marvinbryantia formatexigens DSM 14469]|uniref:Uncharacterized protein n=1 Tax=Marvinbryantia formatexigens DSM 14469 TaxID=478749 RepID=C6L8X1_9FIRM|nr:hypothetical protein BRYFOR_05060 [Marvinbryantia formatexigens DSM 14469]
MYQHLSAPGADIFVKKQASVRSPAKLLTVKLFSFKEYLIIFLLESEVNKWYYQ